METSRSPARCADAIVRKLKAATECAQAALAVAQQEQEEQANRKRDPAYSYAVGDKVWLDLRNVKTDRPNKKLDVRYAKFEVLEKVGSHACRLNTPGGIHDVFNVKLLRPSAEDPLPSQRTHDHQPPARMTYGEEEEPQREYEIEKILAERTFKGTPELRVKWVGYARPTWEPRSAFENTVALDEWENQNPRGGWRWADEGS
ncbi:hypothetical protein ACJ73_10378 [Blastomyces percursus]|uniref:Chromo domain-containing protein n=1 Tax=Blastomyces percursus TaxID=1658174 RepID=A0A1J9PNE1_9EURO|nr:hypothetical protein ACJ73_10378 [Blastomyces percursus]